MSYGMSKMYARQPVAEAGDVSVAAVAVDESDIRSLREARTQIATLKSINAHLVQQLNLLKQREAQAQALADRDGLTGLFSRRKMIELLDEAMADATLNGTRVGVLFIDLDGFKGINDSYGHAVGDQLLVTVASRIAGRARVGDSVCRYGGDEFVVILPRAADVAAVRRVADSIGKRVALPYRIAGRDLNVSAAIGVAVYPDQAGSGAALLERADASMYQAKAGSAARAPVREHSLAPGRRRDDWAKRRALP